MSLLRPRQSRSVSLAEAVTNVVAGFLVAMLAQQIVFPLFGITTTLAEDAGIAAVFTGLSLVRGYAVRRLFERMSGRGPGRGRPLVEDTVEKVVAAAQVHRKQRCS